jgi:hypothetical protein
MTTAGKNLGGNVWSAMQTFAIPEFQKIAAQIVSIEAAMLQNPPPFTQDGARVLLNMQVTASVGIIVGMTTLTMLAVQSAINQILSALKTTVNTAVKFPLIS